MVASPRPDHAFPARPSPFSTTSSPPASKFWLFTDSFVYLPRPIAFGRSNSSQTRRKTEKTHGAGPDREGTQHRHLGPHRLGQDDAHGAHPLLYGSHPRHPRSAW